jgi:hypothetical protein
MRPAVGVTFEVVALVILLFVSPSIPPGLPLGLYLIVTQLVATYLIHCPAHYVVGMLGGIRFRKIRPGRTTLVKVLPPRLAGLARLIPILTLSTDKVSLSKASRRKVAAMYASGTIASSCSGIIIAAAISASQPLPIVALAWLVAVGYLIFDVVFSPRSGDLMRARAALRLLTVRESVDAEERKVKGGSSLRRQVSSHLSHDTRKFETVT